MKTYKGVFLSAALLLLVLVPFGISKRETSSAAQDRSIKIEKVRVVYGERRPFSWYYPYNYQYYYPRHSSNSCYWIYTNGTYVYTCN